MVTVNDIIKKFGHEQVLDHVSFSLNTGKTMSILGKSGCGKTTLLKLLAGMEVADGGQFHVRETDMFAISPQKRGVVYLSQEPLLFPHLSVFKNLSFGLEIRKENRKTIKEKTEEMADKLGLSLHLDKLPYQLSGGQKQRVNFGRALIIDPEILLLDEPFGSLDSHTRSEMQQLFTSVRESVNLTALFVTHDIKEALLMGEQVASMDAGKLHVFESIADFVSSPESGIRAELEFWEHIKEYQS